MTNNIIGLLTRLFTFFFDFLTLHLRFIPAAHLVVTRCFKWFNYVAYRTAIVFILYISTVIPIVYPSCYCFIQNIFATLTFSSTLVVYTPMTLS